MLQPQPLVFTEDSPFVLADNRRRRPVLPTTAAALNRRHGLLFPERVVAGARVLDLGCCIGATGAWVQAQGAARYVGVEHQERYVEKARQLLAFWPQAELVRSDVVEYLPSAAGQFEVVALLGVLHGLYDPLALLNAAARASTRYVCVEDFGPPLDAPVLVADDAMRMPIAGELAGTIGFGWQLSPGAVGALMRFLGFARDMEPVFIASDRWLCRYLRVAEPGESAAYSSRRSDWDGVPDVEQP